MNQEHVILSIANATQSNIRHTEQKFVAPITLVPSPNCKKLIGKSVNSSIQVDIVPELGVQSLLQRFHL